MLLQGKALPAGVEHQSTLWIHRTRVDFQSPSSRQLLCSGHCCALPYATETTSDMLIWSIRNGRNLERHPVAPCGMEAAVHKQKGWPSTAVLQTVTTAISSDSNTISAVRPLPDAPASCCNGKLI